MRRDRTLAALLFAAAGVPGGLAVASSFSGLSPFYVIVAALGGALASGAAGALAGPALGAEARGGASLSKGAVLGALVAICGVVIASAAITLAPARFSASLPEAFVGMVGSLLVVSLPWMGFGAVAGLLFYSLARRAQHKAV